MARHNQKQFISIYHSEERMLRGATVKVPVVPTYEADGFITSGVELFHCGCEGGEASHGPRAFGRRAT